MLVGGCLASVPGILAAASDSRQTSALSPERLWQKTVDFVSRGEFGQATDTIHKIDSEDATTERVRAWLDEFNAKREARRELDAADFEKYVGYAKARIDREEYHLALRWVLHAADCAEERDAFLAESWVQKLVNDALAAASTMREEREWRDAWRIYSYLGLIFEREPRYEKLEREVLTHLRYESMFKEDSKSKWEERIERVRWRDAERAMELIAKYYVEPAEFRAIARDGLEHILLLANSKSAQEQFEGLGSEVDRNDFKARVQAHLDQVLEAPAVDRREAVEHFRRVVKKINKQTVRLPEELVVAELMRGALAPLDDFTTIIWPYDIDEFDKHTRGDFVGVGISIIKNAQDEIEVVSPLEDTPAYRAGIQAGDIIVRADDIVLKEHSLNKVVTMITGEEGTSVTLTVRRDGEELQFPLVRSKVKIRSVKGIRRDPNNEERWEHWLDRDLGIGYIRIANFQGNTIEDVENVLSGLVGLKGLVLDLRGNPGGLLESAWRVTSLFVERGDTIVSTKGRIKSDDHVFNAPASGAYSDIPLVVLVDEQSASASEIVSGALRDNGHALVVGERTYGKFSVQNLVPLGGAGAKLKITTARYYLPSGASLHRAPDAETWGVEPDVPVRLVRKEAIKLYQMRREANLLGPPKAGADDDDEGDDEGDDGDDDEADDEAAGDKEDESPDIPAGKAADTAEDGDEKDDEPKLPPLKQPDPNDRPKADPQLDAALLLMRVTLIEDSFPAHAMADMKPAVETANP
jgi:carboxyl-terminal processing protease